MSSAPEGWYVDPSTGTNLRRWNGNTWTDEVAPLPHEPEHSGPVDIFAAAASDTSASDASTPDTPASDASASDASAASNTPAAPDISPASAASAAAETPEETETPETPETREAPQTAEIPDSPVTPDTLPEADEPTESVPDGLPDQAPGDGESVEGGLDPEIELTQLTRRELRARRGDEAVPDDTPKHLPPITPVTVVPVEQWMEPVEELDIPSPPVAQEDAEDADPGRRRRIVRLSVLLGVLAVVSSVAVLTAGTI